MNSIVTVIKNRCRVMYNGKEKPIYKKSLSSIIAGYNLEEEMELILVDFGSTDTDYKFIDDYKIKFNKIIVEKSSFNLGMGRNLGAMNSKGDNLFFLDADMLFPDNFFTICSECLNQNIIYCPICFDECRKIWHDYAHGNIILKRNQFNQIGHWEEKETWGKEDSNFYSEAALLFKTRRERLNGFIHQGHNIMYESENQKWKC